MDRVQRGGPWTWGPCFVYVLAEHHLKTSHAIDWDSATCLTYSTDYYQRITLESWFTKEIKKTCSSCIVELYKHFSSVLKNSRVLI